MRLDVETNKTSGVPDLPHFSDGAAGQEACGYLREYESPDLNLRVLFGKVSAGWQACHCSREQSRDVGVERKQYLVKVFAGFQGRSLAGHSSFSHFVLLQ